MDNSVTFSDLVSRTPIEAGWSGDAKYKALTADGTAYFLRVTPRERGDRFARLFEMQKAVAGTGIPMCTPIVIGECAEGVYTLHSWVDGEDAEPAVIAMPRELQYGLGRDAGQYLTRIHAIPAPADQPDWEPRFNAKIDRKLRMYAQCPIHFEGDSHLIRYIEENRHLLAGRPQCFQHGDYHIGNMMLTRKGGIPQIVIIDFDRYDFGDPWEEFNRIVWCAQAAPSFATGLVDGYFGGTVPMEFWRLLALYISSNMLSSIPWAIPFGEGEIQTMLRQARDVLAWYANMTNPVPTWYDPSLRSSRKEITAMSLPFRQVHLDFHTSECIEGIGSRFTRENFAAALKAGHVNSITLFSKCHHGWSYHPTKANFPHPHLSCDLLGEQLAVCRELGVRTEIYVSAGLSEQYAYRHPEHLQTGKDGHRANFDAEGHYHRLCFNTPYLDQLTAEIEEVLTRYKGQFDGLFLDIIGMGPCWCDHCRRGMAERGLNPDSDADAWTYARVVYDKYTDRVAEVVERIIPGLPIIHNDGGAIFQGRDIAFRNQGHFELESLPTGGWGYDHVPRAAAYARTLGRDYLGMTGKFHQTWGEFGGFKHPNALRYEAALANACGARCSVGDQLHPDGEFDLSTYRLIGAAYADVEQREIYLEGSALTADIGLLSAENFRHICPNALSCGIKQDLGANRIMLEGHYLYDILDPQADFNKYRLLILPDTLEIPEGELRDKLNAYLETGGKLLLTGRSGTCEGRFVFDFGADFGGEGEYRPAYLRPCFALYPNGETNYVTYSQNYDLTLRDDFAGEVRGMRVDPYFNRAPRRFCSHRHTPYDREKTSPVALVTRQIGYIGWDMFTEYAECGSVHTKYAVMDIIDRLLGEDKTLTCTLPSCGVTSVAIRSTGDSTQYIHQMVYAIPKVRGNGTEIIEDLPPVPDVVCTLAVPAAPKRVFLAPGEAEIPFVYENGKVTYTVPSFTCAAMVVAEV